MRQIVLALIVFPVVGSAQTTPAGGRWSFEVATGLTASSGEWTDTFGPTLEFIVDRALTQYVSLRVAADWGAISGLPIVCPPPTPGVSCTRDYGITMAGLSAGITAGNGNPDAGPYVSVRAGAYMLGTEPGVQPGGYAGVGVAAPTRFGAFTFEIGIHGAVAESPNWMVPARVGLRWRP